VVLSSLFFPKGREEKVVWSQIASGEWRTCILKTEILRCEFEFQDDISWEFRAPNWDV
jgi:hypothetical protein